MLKMFFEAGDKIGTEAAVFVGITIMLVMFVGFTVETIVQARKAERGR